MSSNSTLKTVIAILAIAGLAFAGAVTLKEYYFPSTGTILPKTEATIYVEGVPRSNNTLIDWGTMQLGETLVYNFTVQNTGTTTFNVSLWIEAVPIGISYVWTANNTVLSPGEYAKADLELTVSISAVNGTYSMGTYHVLLLKEA